jgi:peptidoglycan biosynthesis protein MviN/MurJ (putative lipid II flippase)
LALAVAIADSLYALVLIILLNRRINYFDFRTFFLPATKIIFAAGLTGISLYLPLKLLDQLVFDTTRTVPLIMLTGTVSFIGLSVYFFFTWVLQIEELRAFLGLFKRAKNVIIPTEAVTETEAKP